MTLARIATKDDFACYTLPEKAEAYIQTYLKGRPVSTTIVTDRCGYDEGAGWHDGRCGKPTPCPRHDEMRCGIHGSRATGGCTKGAGNSVCGYPICPECENNCGRHG